MNEATVQPQNQEYDTSTMISTNVRTVPKKPNGVETMDANIDDETELQKWRDQEPINAHSHLLSMLVGSSESIPVVDGNMVIGQWQSVLLVDLDGPRDRTVGIQFLGYH